MAEPRDNGVPGSGAYARHSSGELMEISALLSRNRREGEAEMTIAHLRTGDVLAMSQAHGKRLLFSIEEAQWDDLGVSGNFSPTPTLAGTLEGDDLPNEVKDRKAFFGGSGFGGSMRQVGVIATGRTPFFRIQGVGEFRGAPVDYFEIFRKKETGELQSIEPNQLDAEARKDSSVHAQRLERIRELMHLFGFDRLDYMDGTKAFPEHRQRPINEPYSDEDFPMIYEDERYKAQYVAGMAMGNQLAVFDKEKRQWMEFKYFNYNNDDFLQIAFADLSGHDIDELYLMDYLCSESTIHASGEPIITFASSGRYGINAINYHLGDRQISDLDKKLGIQLSHHGMSVSPDIQLWPEGQVRISGPFLSGFEKEHPGTTQKIQDMVDVAQSEEVSLFKLNDEEIRLKNPDREIEFLIRHLETRQGARV